MTFLTAGILLAAGCGGGGGGTKSDSGDPKPKDKSFHIKADAVPFAGPAPLTIKFSGKVFRTSGNVQYRWNFDDGTTTTQKNPVHTFPKPGYYLVLLDARDDKENDRWNLYVGAWPKDVWKAATSHPITKKVAKNRSNAQQLRTRARKRQTQASQAQRTANL